MQVTVSPSYYKKGTSRLVSRFLFKGLLMQLLLKTMASKVQILWEGHKIWKNVTHSFEFTYIVRSKQIGIFFQNFVIVLRISEHKNDFWIIVKVFQKAFHSVVCSAPLLSIPSAYFSLFPQPSHRQTRFDYCVLTSLVWNTLISFSANLGTIF